MLPKPVATPRVDGSDTRGWCQFDLGRCVGGIASANRDLQYLPVTVLPVGGGGGDDGGDDDDGGGGGDSGDGGGDDSGDGGGGPGGV